MAQITISTLCLAVCITGLILSSSVDVSLGEQAVDCCLKVGHRPIPKHIIACYSEQIRGEGCHIDAIVFQTRKGRQLCAHPQAAWVRKLMSQIDEIPKSLKKKFCKTSKDD